VHIKITHLVPGKKTTTPDISSFFSENWFWMRDGVSFLVSTGGIPLHLQSAGHG
jgi:hypothetical protein